MSFDLSFLRAEFPALDLAVNGQPAAFLDGPAGTQVPQLVITAMTDYLTRMNANTHGAFHTSRLSDQAVELARRAVADFLGAASWQEIAFGANMTTLNFQLSRALGRGLRPGDEIIVTELDHDANVAPWLALAEQGAIIRWLRVNPETCTLNWGELSDLLSERTRVLAIGHAANATGTVNDVARATRLARAAGATVVVDAVHSAPHLPIDVQAIGCDFLLCSAYKFFGPHVGILYGRMDAFAALDTYRVRPQSPEPPEKMETGTLNHEGIYGTAAAVAFIAEVGRRATNELLLGEIGTIERRMQILAGMATIEAAESELCDLLLAGLQAIPGVRIYGPPPGHPRTPTVSFTLAGRSPAEVAGALGEQGIFVWDGDFYARTIVERLGLAERGGLVRVGLAPYNTAHEVNRLVTAVAAMA